MNRRYFLKNSAALGASAMLLGCAGELKRYIRNAPVSDFTFDPKSICHLPKDFSYKVICQSGEVLRDGLFLPGLPDGMATFAGKNGQFAIVKNHEQAYENYQKLPAHLVYDPIATGGTSTIVLDKNLNILDHKMSLGGTLRNCAGGKTPWNTWLSCEEAIDTPQSHGNKLKKKHGYVFEVRPFAESQPEPIIPMGRFKHEAAAVQISTGFVFQTEDQKDSCFYRYKPKIKNQLMSGGQLEALMIKNMPKEKTKKWDAEQLFKPVEVEWLPVSIVDPDEDTIRETMYKMGAAQFSRGEGLVTTHDSVYFTATTGGNDKDGQIFRLFNKNGREFLELYAIGGKNMRAPDNITVAPWGDLIVCEDLARGSRIVGIQSSGRIYDIAQTDKTEWVGACFSPDGQHLFASVQGLGLTLAITGPWDTISQKLVNG